jgi:hypothetical protein
MRSTIVGLSLLSLLIWPASSLAQGRSAIARETAEYVVGRFGKEAAKEGVEGLRLTAHLRPVSGTSDSTRLNSEHVVRACSA